MARPRTRFISLSERLERLAKAGLREGVALREKTETDKRELQPLISLEERIAQVLNLLKATQKSTDMNFMVMYDIENNKVRTEVAKYLIKAGCVRIQKSVYLASMTHARYQEIVNTLTEVQQYYENVDSILILPVNTSDARAMKIIGKDIQVQTIIDKPNTLFF